MKRELKAGAGATLLVAGALSVALIGGAGSGAAAGTPSSAYGISGTGLIPVPMTPYVVSTDGSTQTGSAIPVAIPGLADIGVINAMAENDHATASVASVSLTGGVLQNAGLDAALQPLVDGCAQLANAATALTDPLSSGVTALLTALGQTTVPLTNGELLADPTLSLDLNQLCDTLDSLGELVGVGAVTAECTGHTGVGKVASINLLGLPVDLPTGVNQALSDGALGALAPLVDIKLNTQTTNADGTFTVTALQIDLLDQIHLKVASVTCGHVTTDGPTAPAPSPKPIKTNVAVTG
jgi:hypothetical protein